jgi:UDPglucose--hexose-1-phosphate uridylyltransferase
MNEMRHDWLSDRWVIYAPNRSSRPDDFRHEPRPDAAPPHACPFCQGAEHETPEATLVLPDRDWESTRLQRAQERQRNKHAAWLVRVVPNKFPAVTAGPLPIAWSDDDAGQVSENASLSEDAASLVEGAETLVDLPLFRRRRVHGAHEVIIESPEHVPSITHLPLEHAEWVFEAYRRRMMHWRARADMKYAVIFKNFGADAGATLFHSHSQLICTDFVPSDIVRVQKRLNAYLRLHQRCYWCDVLRQELTCGDRIVALSEHFVALCPFASRFPYGITILPRTHRTCFENTPREEIRDLAQLMMQVLQAFEREHPQSAYNYLIQTAPFDVGHNAAFHWRIKILPRMSKVAGFEWSSDCFINTVLPEDSAAALRARIGRPIPTLSSACVPTNAVSQQ